MTPVQPKLDCSVPKCNKTLKNQKNLTSHLEKVHKVVNAISQSSLANSVRTLFTGENAHLPSTQGNSSGQVNSPKVRSKGTFKCGACEKDFSTNEDAKEHMKTHDNAVMAEESITIQDDEEVEQEIASIAEDMEFERVPQEVENLVMVDRIVDSFVENAYQAMNPSEERNESFCHECFCKDQVINNYKKLLDEKDSLITEKKLLQFQATSKC